jgi:transaldolase
VDVKVDPLLAAGSPLRGRVAIANARRAYARYRERFAGERWERLRQRGGSAQRPLWASTGTKDRTYSDVLYVEQLIAPGVINTMPEATLRAFDQHGEVQPFDPRSASADATLDDAALAGVDLPAITGALEREGIQAFAESYEELVRCIERKIGRFSPSHVDRAGPNPGVSTT